MVRLAPELAVCDRQRRWSCRSEEQLHRGRREEVDQTVVCMEIHHVLPEGSFTPANWEKESGAAF